jgi:hypothetical protein
MMSEGMCKLATRLLTGGRGQFDLTGGNDTRLMAASISHIAPKLPGSEFVCHVAGTEDHPDVRIAREIARICQWKLLRVDRYSSADAHVEELRSAAIRADGTCPADLSWGFVQHELESAPPGEWRVGSCGGELLRGFFWSQEMLSLGCTNKLNYRALLAYRLYASRGVDVRLFGEKGPSLDDHDEVLLAGYREIDKMGEDLVNAYKLDAMYVHKMCYAAGDLHSWLAGLRNFRFPLLSWEITRLGLSLPWKFRTNRGLVLSIIERLDPRLSNIANDKGEPMKPLGISTFPFYVLAALPVGGKRILRLLKKMTGRFAGAKRAPVTLPQSAFFSVIEDAKQLNRIIDGSMIDSVRAEAALPKPSDDCLRTFYTLCTMELLLREVPNLRAHIVF